MNKTISDRTLIFAHRGANKEAAENTRSAFEKALRYPIDGIETDVQLSRDGIPLLWHDRFMDKLGYPEKRIDDFDYSQLEQINFAGSFSEGVDLPGDLLKCVIVVGVPLGKPDLETEELIAYYDKKFGKGWNYGYMMPAMTRVIQSAGRCIRTENDRGVIIFLDERFAWQNYYNLFPKDWDIKITGLYEKIRKYYRDVWNTMGSGKTSDFDFLHENL